MLREDRAAVAHPSDGAGRASLVVDGSTVPAVAGQPGRWRIEFQTGPLGIAVGGAIYLQVSPFWGWSTPQAVDPELPGFTLVTTEAAGVELDAETVDQQLLQIEIGGRPLAAGERVLIEYGAGSRGARADSYAESASTFWLAVDGDGDGRRRLLESSPAVEVVAGAPARLVLLLPATAAPGDRVPVTVAVLDAAGNAGAPFAGTVELESDAVLETPSAVRLEPEDRGRIRLEARAPREGTIRLRARTDSGLAATSNPLVVSDRPRVVWADLHGHSAFSDGSGTPRDYFTYARDVAALEVVALTDHDSWGLEPLATHPNRWTEILTEAEHFDRPGSFVALAGFEWTNWIFGHRHVLFFSAGGQVFDSLDTRFEQPAGLWSALRGSAALTVAHHSAGGPIAVDWRARPDRELEPISEIVSVHGSSEAPDSPHPIYSPVEGNFVRDLLDRGERLGFVGSGDSHDGHPGLAHLGSPRFAGLAGIVSESLDRPAILAALGARAAYATNGPRIVLRTTLGGEPMGATVREQHEASLTVEVAAVAPVARVDIVRSGVVEPRQECRGELDCVIEHGLELLRPGEYLYVRVVQEDGGAAWSSPFFVE
jgi:hypothetical protein